MTEAPLRDRIAATLDRLTPAERKVAAVVSADEAAVAGTTLATLARDAGVSEPTVIRFCRAVGLDGFAGLRLALLRAEAAGPARGARPIGPGMPPEEAVAATLDSAIATLEAARRSLDGASVARAALILLRASRVEIWASGASFAAARHLEAALLGPCRGVATRADGAMQALAAATLDSDAVALCIDRTGAERTVVEAARIAAEAGATVLAIAPPASPLAAVAALAIACEAEAGAAGVLQLALAEALATAAGLLAPPRPAARAERIAAASRLRQIES